MPITESDVQRLFEDMARGVDAWIHGRLEQTAVTSMIQSEDMTIFGPFGGNAARNGPALATLQSQVVSRFRGGSSTCELVHWMTSGDLVVLVMIERSKVLFEGRQEPQSWVLRTTQVFRRDGDGWLRLHRHADPLILRRSFDDTLALAADGETR